MSLHGSKKHSLVYAALILNLHTVLGVVVNNPKRHKSIPVWTTDKFPYGKIRNHGEYDVVIEIVHIKQIYMLISLGLNQTSKQDQKLTRTQQLVLAAEQRQELQQKLDLEAPKLLVWFAVEGRKRIATGSYQELVDQYAPHWNIVLHGCHVHVQGRELTTKDWLEMYAAGFNPATLLTYPVSRIMHRVRLDSVSK